MDQRQLETTLAVTQAMASELTDYLMGDNLYRQLIVKTPSGTKQPKMTLGALLENVQALRSAESQLTAAQRAALAGIEDKVALDRRAFAGQWQALLRRELRSLLDSWKWYLDDVGRDPAARENYASEAHLRTRVEVVMAELAGDSSLGGEQQQLGALDSRLREMLRSGAYVGPRGEETRFPADRFWWLYGRPPSGNG